MSVKILLIVMVAVLVFGVVICEQPLITIAGLAVAVVVHLRYSRRPDYRHIRRMERGLGYQDLTSVPARRIRRRGRR